MTLSTPPPPKRSGGGFARAMLITFATVLFGASLTLNIYLLALTVAVFVRRAIFRV